MAHNSILSSQLSVVQAWRFPNARKGFALRISRPTNLLRTEVNRYFRNTPGHKRTTGYCLGSFSTCAKLENRTVRPSATTLAVIRSCQSTLPYSKSSLCGSPWPYCRNTTATDNTCYSRWSEFLPIRIAGGFLNFLKLAAISPPNLFAQNACP